jgi:methyl-accepting chemotaxis protein
VTGWLANRRIRTKMLISIAVMMLAALVTGGLALGRMAAMDSEMSTLRADNVQDVLLLSDIRGAQSLINHYAALRAINPRDAAAQATAANGTAAAVEQLNTILATYTNQPNPPEIQQAIEKFSDLWGQFTNAMANTRAGRPPGIDFNAVIEGMEEAVTELSKLEAAEVDAAVAVAHEQYADARLMVLLALALGLVAAVALSMVISNSITGRLARVITAMNAMAAGDLSRRTDVAGGDEVGTMATAVNQATSSVRETVAALARSADLVARSSTQLDSVTAGVAGSAERVSQRARAADEAASQVSGNVQTVAAASQEMAGSIAEIARNASEGARVAVQAVSVVSTTNETVSKLGESSTEIGNVVKVITSIAEQTNLLALNATIEAARAGETGKGFAVVAGEVKELAQETARATEDIARRVQAIQADSGSAVAAIEEISAIIGQINSYQTSIASAVDEQTATTGEMTRNVGEAARGASSIAETIAEVAATADETSRTVDSGRQASRELAALSGELQQLVARFTH